MNRKLTPEKLAKITKIAKSATPGPWVHDSYQTDIMFVFGPEIEMIMSRSCEGFAVIRGFGAGLPMDENGEFIANSRQDVPDLLEHIAALEDELSKIRG
jgi:hypothetical protein